jgi:type VI protein secretion system component Hcp
MKLIIITLLFAAQAASAQVGIGTTNPSSNSVLDLTSPNKGLMLPRLSDTTSVSSPSAGLMIYDQNAQSPAFHNGSKWNTLASVSAMSGTFADSITYSFSGPNNFVQGNFKVKSMSYGGTNSGGGPNATSVMDVNITKDRDINSINFLSTMMSAQMNGIIEFKMYVPGAATPYYSVKLTNWYVSSVMQGLSIGSEMLEQISFFPTTIGFKDWINNFSFSFNTVTHTIGTY